MSELSVFVFGAGRAGRSLAAALVESGVNVCGLHGRRAREPQALAGGQALPAVTQGRVPDAITLADVVLVTVRDSQLEVALAELGKADLKTHSVILHASGSVDPLGLEELRSRGHPAGTFHPLLPLSDAANASALLRDAWIGVDGDAEAKVAASRLAGSVGAHIIEIPESSKPLYHAAAVLASNFPTVLAYLARTLLTSAGVAPDAAAAAVISLMNASVENLRGRDPGDALTGPVVRGDSDTVRVHMDALRDNEDALAAYRSLTRVAVKMARRSGTDTEALRTIEQLADGFDAD